MESTAEPIKAVIYHGVYPYASAGSVDVSRGYVSRECHEDGRPIDSHNYGGVTPVRVYRSKTASERYAANLSGF